MSQLDSQLSAETEVYWDMTMKLNNSYHMSTVYNLKQKIHHIKVIISYQAHNQDFLKVKKKFS